jgi:nicotinate-nucleotide pyrophosphorylase (carboxylating)
MMKVETEVGRLEQLTEVLEVCRADIVLVDNMDEATSREAVRIVDGHLRTEASDRRRLG